MKVYLDIVFFLNFMFDLLLLVTVSIEQKRYPKKRKLFFASLFASLTTFLLFLPFTNFTLFLFKIMVSFGMIFLSFGRKNFVSNLKSLYGNSILLGGMIYAIDLQIRYHPNGFLFFKDKTTFSFFLILLGSPILFSFYTKGQRKEKEKLNLRHHVELYYHERKIEVDGYLDTGNCIKDPYKKRSVLVLFHKDFHPNIEESILVPYKTVGHRGIIRCVKVEKLYIDQQKIEPKKILIGQSEEILALYGASCIIPSGIIKED